MLYSADMTGHAVIGEAAVNLAVREQEITVDSLLSELNVMLRTEELSGRIARISAALAWLRDFRTVGARGGAAQSWMLFDAGDLNIGGEAIIRLQADEDDEMR